MNRCPISYETCENHYSESGLKLLSPQLTKLNDFPYGQSQQLELAIQYSDKLSFSGVQPKLNATVNLKKQSFEVVRSGGTFILKLPHGMYQELPQNEDLTMRLAKVVNIEVPLHGMIYAIDRSLVYFVKRFDRKGKQKIAIEDFGQLAELPNEAKYDFSMERLIPVLNKFCTISLLDKLRLFRLVLFNFLVGNEDMHIKNFSVIRENDIVKLSPAYDLVNSTIVMNSKEEIGLPLRGKKANLKRDDFLEYYGKEKLGLSNSHIDTILTNFQRSLPSWKELIDRSFLSPGKKEAYLNLVDARARRLLGTA